MAYGPPKYMPYEPFLLGVGVVFNLLRSVIQEVRKVYACSGVDLSKIRNRKGTPQRTCATKILPNFRVNFLVRFASKPLLYWAMTGKPVELFRKFFGTVRAILWPWVRENPDLPKPPKPRKIQSHSKVTKKWLFGVSPKLTLKVTSEVTFWPERWLKSDFFGSKSYFWGYF